MVLWLADAHRRRRTLASSVAEIDAVCRNAAWFGSVVAAHGPIAGIPTDAKQPVLSAARRGNRTRIESLTAQILAAAQIQRAILVDKEHRRATAQFVAEAQDKERRAKADAKAQREAERRQRSAQRAAVRQAAAERRAAREQRRIQAIAARDERARAKARKGNARGNPTGPRPKTWTCRVGDVIVSSTGSAEQRGTITEVTRDGWLNVRLDDGSTLAWQVIVRAPKPVKVRQAMPKAAPSAS